MCRISGACLSPREGNLCHMRVAILADCVWAAGYERLYREAAQRLEELGGVPVPIDFEPFATVAGLLYTSAFLAERYSGVRAFLEAGQVRCPHMRSASRMHAKIKEQLSTWNTLDQTPT